MNKLIIPVLFAAIAIFFYACPNSDNVIDPSDVVFPEENVSFSQHVLPILSVTCSRSGCHGINNDYRANAFYDYASLFHTQNIGYIVPENPSASLIYQIIIYAIPHNPFYKWNLSENHTQGIKQWILEGALNN